MTTEYSVSGKICLVTGAASGIGAGVAERFLEEGAKHVSVMDVAAAGETVAEKLNATFGAGRASFVRCDVTDEAALAQSFRAVVARHGRVDVVINSAGIMDDSPSMYRKAIDVNWQALVTLTLLARQHMRADRGGAGGTVANVSSILGLMRLPHLPVYSGSKAAVLHFSRCLGMEEHYGKTKVRVLTMCFGATNTPLLEKREARCYDDDVGQDLAEISKSFAHQEVGAAVEGVSSMVRLGASGSTWLATDNKPARDISPVIDKAFDDYLKAISE